MKRWLALSLASNVGLFVLVLVVVLAARHPAKNATAQPAEIVRTQEISSPSPPQTASVAIPKSQDLNSWLNTLRDAGVPNKILASVVIADFENRWGAKERDLQQKYDTGEIDADALNQAETERVAERERTLRNALGEAGYRQWDKDNTLHDLNLDSVKLSDAESDSLYQLKKNLLQSQQDLEQASRDGKIDGTDLSQKLFAAQTQYDAQAQVLLGNDRYTAMNNSPDPVNADLRRKTKELHTSDDQLTAMASAQKDWNTQRAALEHQLETAQVSPEQHDAQMQALDAARDSAYQRALGTNAFADFQKSQDANYQSMKRYSAAWQLNDTDVDYLYRSLQYYKTSVLSYEQQAQSLQSQGQPVDWSGVQKSISQFSGQLSLTLQNYLGDDRFKKLQENNILTLAK